MFFRSLKNFDWLIFSLILILAVFSLTTLFSIDSFYFYRQLIWFGIGIVVILLGSQLNWQWFFTQNWFRYGFYWVAIALLIIPFLQPGRIRGTKSWIVMGNLQFEPSELAKIALIFVLAGLFSRRYLAAWRGKNIFTSFLYMLVPFGIVALQPDLGSALVLAGIWVSFLLLSGINKKRFFIGILILLLLSALMWAYFLKPYQKDRITTFVFPESDPLGASYNVIQSKITIGSAGFWGKGFKSGTQVQLGFLPEAHTDFIFAAFVEEWGIFGGIILLLTYVLLIVRITIIGLKTRRNDLKFLVLGTGLIFLIHFFINIGSNLGIVPVIGISLPFLSYGGSNLLTSSILVSIIERIKIEASY